MTVTVTTTVTIEETVLANCSEVLGTSFYVDKDVVGGLHDGSSWENAWQSLIPEGDYPVDWITIKNAAPATLYISGGNGSKTYMDITANYPANTTMMHPIGGADITHWVTIDVGANSPNPTGHDGIVIFDGGGTAETGILCESSAKYLRINGLDSDNNYKWEIRNIAPITHRGGTYKPPYCIRCYTGSYLYIDGMKFPDYKQFGVGMYHNDYGRIRGCYLSSYDGNYDCIPLGIEVTYCTGTDINNNVSIARTTMNYNANGGISPDVLYTDCMQIVDGTDIIFRNNYMQWIPGRGNAGCGGLMIGSGAIRGNSYLYNNVCIGCSFNDSLVFQIYAVGAGNLHVYNNTIVSQNLDVGSCLHFDNHGSAADIAGIKNNIIVSPNGQCLYFPLGGMETSKLDYNCMISGNTSQAIFINGIYRSWASYTGLGFDAHGINQDPLLDDDDEYRLTALSPCINVGADLSAYFTTDLDGNLRPTGQWDIGAYEYIAP